MQDSEPDSQDSASFLSRLLLILERLSSRIGLTKGVYSVAIVFFVLIVITPAIVGIIAQLISLPSLVLSAPVAGRMQGAIFWSFVIGLVVSSLDVVAGVPLAWLIVRGRGNWTTILDTLADIPFIVPTVALGFSILEFWSGPGGIAQLFGGASVVPPGAILIMLLHFAFSFPVIVRSYGRRISELPGRLTKLLHELWELQRSLRYEL